MTVTILILWFGNIIFDTAGQLSFKAGAIALKENKGSHYWLRLLRNHWIILGISCYFAEFLLWLAFLSLVPLAEGVLLGSINIVAIMIAGRILFKEQLSKLRLLGILFVALGVAIIGIYT